MATVIRVLRNPRHYWQRARKLVMQYLSVKLGDASFFLQGQMDINPKSLWHNPQFASATGGYWIKGDGVARALLRLDPWDVTRRDMLILLLRAIVERNVPGIMAEVGVYRGDTARLIHHFVPERKFFLFDTFQGFTERASREEMAATGHVVDGSRFSDTSLEYVKAAIAAKNGNVQFIQGFFPESIPQHLTTQTFAFVHLDADLYEPVLAGLTFFYPRMAHHGIIVIHDYNAWPGARAAVDEFMRDKLEAVIPMPDKSGSAVICRLLPARRES